MESPEFSRRRPKPWRQLAEVARVSRTGRGLSRGWSLRVAGIAARRLVAVAGPGVARRDADDDVGGCRSSSELGVVARRHNRRCGGVLRAPGDTASAVKCSVASLRGCGHGYAMAGGEMLSGSKRAATTRRKRAGGKWGSKEKLTGSAAVVLGSSGKQRSGRTAAGDLGGPRLKKTAMAVLRCVPACLTWRRGRG